MGLSIPAWFDIYGVTPECRQDESGIACATKYVHELVDAEVASGIPSERIIIGGCSMGGALALYAGLTYDKPLAGIVCLSGFLIQREKLSGVRF